MIQCFERFDEAICNKEVMSLPEQSLDNQQKRKAIAVEVGGKSANCVLYIVFYPQFFHFDSMTTLSLYAITPCSCALAGSSMHRTDGQQKAIFCHATRAIRSCR